MKTSFLCVGIIAGIIVFLMLLCWLMGFGILYVVFRLKIKKKKEQNDYSFVDDNDLVLVKSSFDSDGRKLKTYLFTKTEREKLKLVILAKGSGLFCPDYKELIVKLVLNGYDVFSFDVTDKIDEEDVCDIPKGYQQWIIDLENALGYLKAEKILTAYDDISWIGHSAGGYGAAYMLKNKEFRPSRLVAAATLNSPTGYAQMYYSKLPCFITKPMIYGARAYSHIHYKEYKSATALEGVNSCDIPIKIYQGNKDKVLPFPCSLAAYKDQIKGSGVVTKIVENGTHNLLANKEVIDDVVEYLKENIELLGE